VKANSYQLSLLKPSKAQFEMLLLGFLQLESWASDINLCDLLQVSKRALMGILKPMLKDKLVKGVVQKVMGGEISLFGITSLGHSYLIGSSTCAEVRAGNYSKSNRLKMRLSPIFLPHRLDIQMLRIRAERAGWKNWVNADLGQDLQSRVIPAHLVGQPILSSEFRPDAWGTNPLGERVCLECERTVKSKIRYVAILCDYLMALKREDFDLLMWVSPTQEIKRKLEHLITSITHVQIGSLNVLIPRNRFERIRFLSYDEWGV